MSLLLILAAGVTTCAHPGKRSQPFPSSEFYRVDPAQISTWSADDDVKFFVHGTMGYLHNGSVRTMRDLLTPPARRPRAFRIGSRVYDLENMGYRDDGAFTLDTSFRGNSNAGHDYGTDLADGAKRELIEYLRTR